MNTRKIGSEYEEKARVYLKEHGMQIIESNYRKRIGEIDIIGRDCEYLVFIEVKYRTSKSQGGAAYAIPKSKQQTIYKMAQWYMAEKKIPQNMPCRFDAVLIDGDEINHIKNAW